jgi:hypothetical protein
MSNAPQAASTPAMDVHRPAGKRRGIAPGERAWIAAAALSAAFALVARIHNAFDYPPLYDYDGPGHAFNVYSFHAGKLPSLTSWSGFQPPLYHALGAALWPLLPESVPIHASLRLLSAVAGFAGAAVLWRVLSQRFPAADAAIVAAFFLGVPVVALATSMVGNEMICVLFVTAVLARLLAVPDDPQRALRHALGTALLAGLAVLSKATGWLAVAVAAATYLGRHRGRPRTALLCGVLVAGLPVLLAAPFYGRLVLAAGGSPLAFVTGAALSPELAVVMNQQLPGERHLLDYLYVPIATFTAPVFAAGALVRSVPGLLYASFWSDAHAHFLLPVYTHVLRAESALVFAGLIPTGLGILGVVRLIRSRDPSTLPLLAFAGLLLASLLRYTWILPTYSAVKASYLLAAALPATLALASGLVAFRAWPRECLRAALVVIALAGTALTWHGWWT